MSLTHLVTKRAATVVPFSMAKAPSSGTVFYDHTQRTSGSGVSSLIHLFRKLLCVSIGIVSSEGGRRVRGRTRSSFLWPLERSEDGVRSIHKTPLKTDALLLSLLAVPQGGWVYAP
jgi:hypothetical protein